MATKFMLNGFLAIATLLALAGKTFSETKLEKLTETPPLEKRPEIKQLKKPLPHQPTCVGNLQVSDPRFNDYTGRGRSKTKPVPVPNKSMLDDLRTCRTSFVMSRDDCSSKRPDDVSSCYNEVCLTLATCRLSVHNMFQQQSTLYCNDTCKLEYNVCQLTCRKKDAPECVNGCQAIMLQCNEACK